MKGDRFHFEIIVDRKDNRVPIVGNIQTIVSKDEDNNTTENNYKIDKYTSCEIIEDGAKLSVWLEATEV